MRDNVDPSVSRPSGGTLARRALTLSVALALAAAGGVALTGCGQKGPLQLPPAQKANPATATTPSAAPASAPAGAQR